jgi:hypothetical protein
MPNSIGTAAPRGTLRYGTTKFGGTCPFGVQCGGLPFRGDRSSSFTARPSAWSFGRGIGYTGFGSWVSPHRLLLVRSIRLVLLRPGNVESNPGPDGDLCVGCGLTPAANTRTLLRCREGCSRECHHREACSDLQRGKQHQGIWACGMCVVVVVVASLSKYVADV